MPSQGDRLNFTLSVNAKDEIQLITRELNWYINGNLISNSSDILLTNDNKTLTTVGSPGVYEVRYDGLLALSHNYECEKMLLIGMRHYPIFKPVRILVNTTGIDYSSCIYYYIGKFSLVHISKILITKFYKNKYLPSIQLLLCCSATKPCIAFFFFNFSYFISILTASLVF